MKLSDEKLREFHEEGYLFLPECFSRAEAAMLLDEAQAIYATDREEVWREETGVARTAFAAHTYSEPYRRLGAHPRLIEPVMQILEEEVYMHQFKINAKAAFDGAVWQWHQDYGIWSSRHEHRGFPGGCNRGQRPAAVHPQEPQDRRVRSRPRS